MSSNDRIVRRFFSYMSRYLSTKVVFAIDMSLSLFSSLLVCLLVGMMRIDGLLGARFIIIWFASSALFSALMFTVLRSSHMIIRHSTLSNLLKFGVAAFGKAALMWAALVICGVFVNGFDYDGKFIYLILLDFLMTTVSLIAVRVLMIIAYEQIVSKLGASFNKKRILLYGVNDKSISVVKRLEMSPHYQVIGFVTSDAKLKHFRVSGLPVYYFSSEGDFRSLRSKTAFGAILFTRNSDAQAENEKLVKYAVSGGIGILVAPSIDEVEDGSPLPVREVKIEDLLGREEIRISLDEIRTNFKGRTVMVTGAAGSIGSELCRQLASFGIEKLVLFDNAETPMHNLRLELSEKFPELEYVPVIGDVRLLPRLDFAFRTHRPSVVFHAAAYKHVPLMEENPCEAVLVNVAGSRNVADKCLEYGVEKMVMISTDKAVNPTNIMGCTKRLAEIYVQSLGLAVEAGAVKGVTKFVTTRFGNVLGSNGSVIPRFREQILKGGPVTVTHPDITRFFMTIPEACRLVMEAATMRVENRICVFDMGEPVKIDLLARRMIELSGYRPGVDIKVKYTGLRPGEKLYEEVLSSVENTEPTSHDRIRVARVRSYAYDDARAVADELERLSRLVDIPSTVILMKKTVPEYISNNSRFSEYDKH